MKHIKLFESNKNITIKNVIDDYNELLKNIRPIALKKYYELANDDHYEPPTGNIPDSDLTEDELFINNVSYWRDTLQIEMVYHNFDMYERFFNFGIQIEDYIMFLDTERFGL